MDIIFSQIIELLLSVCNYSYITFYITVVFIETQNPYSHYSVAFALIRFDFDFTPRTNQYKHNLIIFPLCRRPSTMAGPMERIQVLDDIEKDIITCLQCAGKQY